MLGRIDLEPAHSPHTKVWEGKMLVWSMKVHGEYGLELGTLTIRTTGDPSTGRLIAQTSSIPTH